MGGGKGPARFVPVETYPIIGIVGVAVVGAGAYLWKLSQGNEVVWDRKGDWKPWDKIKYDQNTKLLAVNQDFWHKRKAEAAARAEAASGRVVDQI